MTPREIIRARIDALEALSDMQSAINDVQMVEFEPGEAQGFDINVSTQSERQAVAFVNSVPPSVLLAGLRAMERELAALTGVQLAEVA